MSSYRQVWSFFVSILKGPFQNLVSVDANGLHTFCSNNPGPREPGHPPRFAVLRFFSRLMAAFRPQQQETAPPPLQAEKPLWDALCRAMDREQLWKTPGLNLNTLSRHLRTNTTTLSRLYRAHGSSFHRDLCARRINYVLDQLELNPQRELEPLFYEAGFQSYITAWRQFRQIVGVSPKAYREIRLNRPVSSETREDPDLKLFRELDRLVEEKQLYLDPDLDRDKLCALLGTDKNRMGRMVGLYSGSPNLPAYLNRKRIRYATEQMRLHPEWTLRAIAEASGIQSTTNFNRIFREEFGMSPSEYLRRQL